MSDPALTEENRQVLRRLEANGANLEIEQEVEFVHVADSEEVAREIAMRFEAIGAHAKIETPEGEPDDDPDLSDARDVYAVRRMVPTAESITAAEIEFGEIARTLGAEPDGWGFLDESSGPTAAGELTESPSREGGPGLRIVRLLVFAIVATLLGIAIWIAPWGRWLTVEVVEIDVHDLRQLSGPLSAPLFKAPIPARSKASPPAPPEPPDKELSVTYSKVRHDRWIGGPNPSQPFEIVIWGWRSCSTSVRSPDGELLLYDRYDGKTVRNRWHSSEHDIDPTAAQMEIMRAALAHARAEVETAALRGEIQLPTWWRDHDEIERPREDVSDTR